MVSMETDETPSGMVEPAATARRVTSGAMEVAIHKLTAMATVPKSTPLRILFLNIAIGMATQNPRKARSARGSSLLPGRTAAKEQGDGDQQDSHHDRRRLCHTNRAIQANVKFTGRGISGTNICGPLPRWGTSRTSGS